MTVFSVGLGALSCAATAQAAETVYGVTGGSPSSLVRFSSLTPGTIESAVPITNLAPAESVRGIDVRPATGELFALGSTGALYRINPGTGAATPIDGPAALTGTRFGVDFNPSVDRLRVVSDMEKNYRYSPLDGSLAFTDTDLTPAGNVVSAAYDRNTGGAPLTTLFALDSGADRLVRIGGVDGAPSPNLGAVTDVGAAGVDFAPDAGFDIAAEGTAYASLTVGATTGLYTVNLGTGAATKVADIGAAVVDIAVEQPRLQLYIPYGGVALARVHADVPVFDAVNVVSGLVPGESIVGLDQRPATGDLVALTDQDRLYLVVPPDADTLGAPPFAAQIGTAALATPVGSGLLGLDFNPTVDRIRVVADNEKNLRLNPLNATIAATDTNLAPAGEVTAAAYTNSFPGATLTTLYDLDSAADTLLRQDPPNLGTLTTIGPLTTSAAGSPLLDLQASNGFDIPPAGGFGILATNQGAATNIRLARVNLAETPVTGGRVVSVGDIPGSSAFNPTGLALLSPGLLTAGSTSAGESGGTAKVAVVRSGGRTGPVVVEFATANGTASAGQDYTATSGSLRFADGENAKVIDVPLLDDSAVEGAEAFTLTLSKPSGGAVLAPAAAAVTITSDDVAPPVVTPPVTTTVTTPAPPAVTPPPPADRTRPLAFVSVNGRQTVRTVRARGLRLQLVAGEPATAKLTATITAAEARRLRLSSRRIATAATSFTAAGVRRVTMRLSAAARRGLARARRPVAVTVRAVVTDTARNVTASSGSGVLPLR